MNSALDLIEVERFINVFDSENNLIQEVTIRISVEELSKFIEPREDDFNFYLGYKLNELQLQKLNTFLDPKIIFLNPNFYYLLCEGTYKW